MLPASTSISTLSLHDALPIFIANSGAVANGHPSAVARKKPHTTFAVCGNRALDTSAQRWQRAAVSKPKIGVNVSRGKDRKSTRLNSSHTVISYAVFCLKKKKR